MELNTVVIIPEFALFVCELVIAVLFGAAYYFIYVLVEKRYPPYTVHVVVAALGFMAVDHIFSGEFGQVIMLIIIIVFMFLGATFGPQPPQLKPIVRDEKGKILYPPEMVGYTGPRGKYPADIANDELDQTNFSGEEHP